ncbi:hypothetical protein BD311DRAFT_170200 [Dichomitus squalens]|uniref:Uncharacterized protein n=1 Tax=Dichomitus squalens TaxID=114155 RepID=A0A4Q9M547_9APHY|nr:hypothetical protein BD311DRAFT_170200 [Dichomitus squalens]
MYQCYYPQNISEKHEFCTHHIDTPPTEYRRATSSRTRYRMSEKTQRRASYVHVSYVALSQQVKVLPLIELATPHPQSVCQAFYFPAFSIETPPHPARDVPQHPPRIHGRPPPHPSSSTLPDAAGANDLRHGTPMVVRSTLSCPTYRSLVRVHGEHRYRSCDRGGGGRGRCTVTSTQTQSLPRTSQ